MNSRKKSALRDNPNLNIPELDINGVFVEACATGDYQTVNTILQYVRDFNIDVTDNLGRTALRLAVASEHIEVVQSLLQRTDSPKLREALLLAIYMGHTQIAELILTHPQYTIFNDKKFLNGATDSFWQTPSSDDAQFSPDITPIMLASQYNRTEIVQMLLVNGDRIEKPHEFHCECNECKNRFKFDSLRHAQSRLNAFRGLSSESYISLASVDPILTAFEMGRELRILSEKEKYFKSEYLHLANKLSEYTVKLLSYVRGRDELETVLNKTGKENEEKFERLARLDLAIKYQEMPFVSHPNCQQKLVEIWYTGIRKVTKMNQMLALLSFLGIICCSPFCALVYLFNPKSRVAHFICQPCVKFITFTTSYVILVFIVLYSSLEFPFNVNHNQFSTQYSVFYKNFTDYVFNDELKFKYDEQDFFIRRNEPSYGDIVLSVWVFGLIINEFKLVYQYGFKEYFLSWSNLVNAAMYFLFFASFSLKYYTMIYVTMERYKLQEVDFWIKVAQLTAEDTAGQIDVYQTFYWLNDDRFYWLSFDPINLSEGLFAMATTLTFAKLCFFLPANQNLGPLQIVFGRMISDILKFIIIFLIFFSGFLFGLNNLYWYYQSSVRRQFEIKRHVNVERNTTFTNAELFFGKIDLTFRTMFWAIFLIGNGESVMIEPFHNQLTTVFGYFLFGSFHVVNITILLNMLIAMMTRSYETILKHSDTEWKFARSKLYMEFIREGQNLPAPFNIIPMPSLILSFFKKLILCFYKKPPQSLPMPDIELPKVNENGRSNGKANGESGAHFKRNGVRNGRIIEEPMNQPNGQKRSSVGGNELSYKKVMGRVVKRFLLHNNRENEDIRESDFDELKQDVQMIRFEMLNNLKNNREDMLRYITILHNGMSILGDYLFDADTSDLAMNFEGFKAYDKDLNELMNTKPNGNIYNKSFLFDMQLRSKKKQNLSVGNTSDDLFRSELALANNANGSYTSATIKDQKSLSNVDLNEIKDEKDNIINSSD